MNVTTIGLDLAKNVFQVHGADAKGRMVFKKRLSRGKVLLFFANLPPCLIGMEACAGAHYWARELQALGHEVRLMPPQYVKPYVKRNKHDQADAEAICEAVTRPSMRFVAIKSTDQQSVLMLHRSRELLVRQRTMLANALRGHLSEFGIVVAKGIQNVQKLVAIVGDYGDSRLPDVAREVLAMMIEQLRDTTRKIDALEKRLRGWHRSNEVSRRLATTPGIGPMTATALVATVGDPKHFASGRQFAAWLGITPREDSTGGKTRPGKISKRGDGYLRRLLIHGARSVVQAHRRKATVALSTSWLGQLLARRHVNIATVAVANRNARIAWALMVHGTVYQPRA
jgi:transposase